MKIVDNKAALTPLTDGIDGKNIEDLRQLYSDNLSKAKGVQILASPLYSRIPSGVYFEMPVLITIFAGLIPQETYQRPPQNLCLVLDRSGSMSGIMGDCKKAIEHIISQLQGDDTLHLVIYDDKVDTVFTNKRKEDAEEMKALLSKVSSRGGTNIMDGLSAGIDLLKNSENIGTKAIFLFSDGQANCGISDGQTIGLNAQKQCTDTEISISTFGLGNSYDEKLLRTIANLGNGFYYYIEDSERIPHVVSRGLHGLGSLWTKEASLFVQGQGSTVVHGVSGFTSIMSPKVFKLRELSLVQHLAKVVCAPGSVCGEVVINFSYVDLKGSLIDLSTAVEFQVGGALSEKNPDVHCYQQMLACSELNQDISSMIAEQKPAAEVIAKKEKVVSLYEEVVAVDRFRVIPALLLREKETLAEFQSRGVYHEAAKKKQAYYAGKACGYAEDAYCLDDEEEEEEECDMGFSLFD